MDAFRHTYVSGVFTQEYSETAAKEYKNSRNELFFDIIKKQVLTLAEFLGQISAGAYPGYTVKDIRGKPTPVSKRDKRSTNNIG